MMSSSPHYTVLVNSCDAFEDCWHPFFKLFAKYWPDCDAKIRLNTETKNWSYELVQVQSTRVQHDAEERLPWSECLIRALDQVQTPLVLYLQEDYFIHRPVRSDLIRKAVKHMIDRPEVKHVGLTKHGSHGPYLKTDHDWLDLIRRDARYRISTQAGLWRVDALRSYLRPEENGWMFEIFGSWRAARRNETFLCADHDAAHGGRRLIISTLGSSRDAGCKGSSKYLRLTELTSTTLVVVSTYPSIPFCISLRLVRAFSKDPGTYWNSILGGDSSL